MSVAPIAPPSIAPVQGISSEPKTIGTTGPDFGTALADARALEKDASTVGAKMVAPTATTPIPAPPRRTHGRSARSSRTATSPSVSTKS